MVLNVEVSDAGYAEKVSRQDFMPGCACDW